MANEINELLNEIRDQRLRERLSVAVGELRKAKQFGLVFEEHLPELLPIPGVKIRRDVRVARKGRALTETFIVQKTAKGIAEVTLEGDSHTTKSIPVAELVAVKRFGEPIFPSLRHVDSILRGDNAPHHTLIEADNYHALQLLEWLYKGKVDCIYIDPPYNTGARDWKYNNNYVDKTDSWRHSKWLSFMQRRLKLAEKLLKPNTGVLIVTVDEHEVHHLRTLLDQEFRSYVRQMVTIVINPKGVTQGKFARVEEHAIFCFGQDATVISKDDDLLSFSNGGRTKTVRWKGLLRSGTDAERKDRETMFYPVWVDVDRGAVVEAGSSLPLGQQPFKKRRNGCVPVWPIRDDPGKSQGRWSVGAETLNELIAKGFVSLGRFDPKRDTYSISYLSEVVRKQIDSNAIVITGFDERRNVVSVEYAESKLRSVKTVWHRSQHDAGAYGSDMLTAMLGRAGSFSFPKSLYSVRDCLQPVVAANKDALILDFFAGSGTTLNAVSLLNSLDGGNRRCILVTNNEVSEDVASSLKADGIEFGDPQWERRGLCQDVTFPRCVSAISGKRPDGVPIEGEYFTDQFVAQQLRRTFRPLEFANAATLSTKKAREALATALEFPKARVSGDEPYLLEDGVAVAVLLDPAKLDEFIAEAEEYAETIETIYLPFAIGRPFNEAKAKIESAWVPLTKELEKKKPMKEGFEANFDYFKLEFLDRSHVETGGKLADLLPALWMMAGCRGKMPTCKGNEKMLFFKDSPFAVLVEQDSVHSFLTKLKARPDIDWVFIVTDDQESFSRMSEWMPDHIPATQCIHLWRNYLDNFLINVERNMGEAP
jgi:adenine-specific DNA-methyltransferase